MKNKTIRILSTTCALASLLISVSPVSAVQPETENQTIDFSQDEDKYSKLCSAISWNLEKNNTCKEYKKYLEQKISKSEEEINEKQSTLIQADNSVKTVTSVYNNKLSSYEEDVSNLNSLKESHKDTQEKITGKKESLPSTNLDSSRVISTSQTDKQLNALHTTDSDHKEAKKNIDSLETMLSLEEESIKKQENIVQYKKEDVELANTFVEKAKETYSNLDDEIKSDIDSVENDKQILEKIESTSQKQQNILITPISLTAPQNYQPVSRTKSMEDLTIIKEVAQERKRIEAENQQYFEYKAEEERKAREEAARQEEERRRQAEEQRKQVGQNIVNAAMTKLGTPYIWGAAGPNSFDCSGLVYWAHKQAGIYFTRTTAAELSHMGQEVSFNELQPGDIITLNTLGYISHVVIYAGNGKIVHAPQTGDVVKVVNFPERWRNKVVSCRRLY